ncbi:ABC transporter ATP-binding protein [Streptomyces cocklensis]|uniref:ABC-type quaternary amine transporter n=1 Tax=Actinacidiphila cocklensis TaxID=887465 RepID=A0A9W4GWB4_9ACTN|nr:ABC transporter ATP-binding protein [Actinacidiphila cocklensis]MDD1062076.1 ABC transporter ATP-binding protein [Actinacidiphila cocklensis]WSX74487.1 ABC transporter ATP-binding protein [Streptomyces sp. NBC_00899]CAG6398803.1 glycine betaine/carnitine/choline/choline ABC transporter (ATP-binding protein) [Actinacidiphila cocklensis]
MIQIESVTKRYPDGTTAVDNLSLDIPDGSITVLVGPSGCGKTTTLRMVNRMVEPTSGRILLDGSDITEQPVNALRRSMGYVIQNAGLFQHRTIVDNIATVPRMLGWDRRKARERARELMGRVGLDESLARRYPYQLSGGQQQRVGVARALAADPPVLLMDEPFSAVDPIVRKSLQAELLRIQQELGKTIVFVTHDIDEAIKIGDMIAVMRTGGRLAQFAPPDELLSSPADAFVEDFLGTDRGIRRLSFFTSDGLQLTAEPVVAVDADAEQVARATAAGSPYLLLTDAEGKPLGWVAPQDAAGGADKVAVGRLLPYGRPFAAGRESLRDALDCAVLSPTGWAVAVDGEGKVAGVVSQETIGAAIRSAHAEHRDGGGAGRASITKAGAAT